MRWTKKQEPENHVPQFSVAKYLEKIENVFCDILNSQEKEDKTIILWWGFDGLRLNKDGTSEWISRKPKESGAKNMAFRNGTGTQMLNLMQYGGQVWGVPIWYNPFAPVSPKMALSSLTAAQNVAPQFAYMQALTNCCCNSAPPPKTGA